VNDYEKRLEERHARYLARSEKAAQASSDAYAKALAMADVIPFGQPILVGHHSETRDRNYRERIDNTFRKAVELDAKAKHYALKAASVGGGGISSDDPDAINKLRAELASIMNLQMRMKAANKAIRRHNTEGERIAALVAEGFSEAQAAELVQPDFAGRVGFAGYKLSNASANARRIEKRIKDLELMDARVAVEQLGNGYTYREDTEENRVLFVFTGKPDEATRAVLKRHAFKWSPSRRAWVRQLTASGIAAAATVRDLLDRAA
jgi:Domain of unknown function (DUF3560).